MIFLAFYFVIAVLFIAAMCILDEWGPRLAEKRMSKFELSVYGVYAFVLWPLELFKIVTQGRSGLD